MLLDFQYICIDFVCCVVTVEKLSINAEKLSIQNTEYGFTHPAIEF